MAKTVLIAIQARSGSTRLPRKAFELIDGKKMLDWVIERCKKAANYLNKKDGISTRIAVLTPFSDPIIREFSSRCDIVEGPHLDVLGRYKIALDHYKTDYVVRITGDCPMIPPYMITRMISLAVTNNYDYISNVDERFRTALDGIDCEVMSAKMLQELAEKATLPEEREHVTLLARRSPPLWAKMGAVVGYFDHSEIKLSVDTPEDLERVRHEHTRAHEKYLAAIKLYGHTAVHTL